jgi:hypothetical protein
LKNKAHSRLTAKEKPTAHNEVLTHKGSKWAELVIVIAELKLHVSSRKRHDCQGTWQTLGLAHQKQPASASRFKILRLFHLKKGDFQRKVKPSWAQRWAKTKPPNPTWKHLISVPNHHIYQKRRSSFFDHFPTYISRKWGFLVSKVQAMSKPNVKPEQAQKWSKIVYFQLLKILFSGAEW